VKGADYLMTIKANQPRLLAAAQQALSGPTTDFVEHTAHDRGHSRTEQRILRTVAVTPEMGIDFPHAAQLFRVIRHVGGLDGQRRTKEVAYCLTSLTPARATEDLAVLLRGHWGAIENKTHWVRDVTFREDASTLRTGTAPQAMAIIRIPSSLRSGSPDGPTSNKPAATSHTASTDASTSSPNRSKRSNIKHDGAL